MLTIGFESTTFLPENAHIGILVVFGQFKRIQSSCECENSSGGEASLGHRGLKMVKVLREKLALKPEFICASGARQNHNHHGAALQVSLLFEAFSLMLETAVKN